MNNTHNRPIVTLQQVEDVTKQLIERIAKKTAIIGEGAFISRNEILGCVTEEYHEFINATHDNDSLSSINELYDIIIASVWGITSLQHPQSTIETSKR
jgi:hypothetical protein